MESNRLVLDNTYSGDAGLASALKVRTSADVGKLEVFSLAGCNISSVGLRQITALLNGLELPHLHYLNLEWNPLINEDDSSIQGFLDAVSKSALRRLSLRECSLNQSVSPFIVNLIRTSVSLQNVELGHNNLGQLDSILDALDTDNHTITEFDLSGNGLTATQSRRLRTLLDRNASFGNLCGASTHSPPDDYPTIPHTPTPRSDRHCVACAAAAELARYSQSASTQLRDALDTLATERSDSKKIIDDLTHELTRAKKHVKDLSDALERKDQEAGENHDRVNLEAKRAVDSVSIERDRLRDESTRLTRELYDLHKLHAKNISDLETTSTRLEGKCAELDTLKARILDEAQQAQEEISRLRIERNTLRQELDNLIKDSAAADGVALQERQSMRAELHKARETQLSAAKVETELRSQISALVAELTSLTEAEARATAAAQEAVDAARRIAAEEAVSARVAAEGVRKVEVEIAIKKTRETVEQEFRARELAAAELKMKIAMMARQVLEAVN